MDGPYSIICEIQRERGKGDMEVEKEGQREGEREKPFSYN